MRAPTKRMQSIGAKFTVIFAMVNTLRLPIDTATVS